MKYPVFMEKEANSDYGVSIPDLSGANLGAPEVVFLQEAQSKKHWKMHKKQF